MRFRTSLNGAQRYVASLQGSGYLNAHLNLAQRPQDPSQQRVVRVVGIDTNSPTENLRPIWPEIPLAEGDVVAFEILPEGPGDPPAVTKRTSEDPSNLFTDSAMAAEALSICSDFQNRLLELLRRAKSSEPEDAYAKLQRATGGILAELGERLLFPIYRRHATLVPEQLKGEIL